MKQASKNLIMIVTCCLVLAGCSTAEKSAVSTPAGGDAQDFSAIISATGVVIPAQWAVLSTHSQGVIAEVRVVEGEQVATGQVLVRLDGQAAAQAVFSTAQFELISAQQALDTLQENAGVETARAQQAVANAMQAVDDAQKDVDKLVYRRATDDLIRQTQDEIDLAKKAISRAEDVFKLVKKRPDGDSIKAEAELALVKARMYLTNRISYLNWYTGLPDEIDSAKYRAALAVTQADLTRSQAELDRRRDGPDTKILTQAEARITLAKAQVRAAEQTVADLVLLAPFDGVVCNLDARVGEWVSMGKPILQLGNLEKMQVETTDLSEIDAARVHPQDGVQLSFDALPDVLVNGRVVWVADKSAAGSGVNYTARIVLDSIPAGLRWGMTAFADIKVSQ